MQHLLRNILLILLEDPEGPNLEQKFNESGDDQKLVLIPIIKGLRTRVVSQHLSRFVS
jgi:hypothetical protein